jgi:general secretion pathway protein I
MKRHPKGFSLLEVLIALAILSISLIALFSSQAGAVKMAYRARHIGVATLLARCKMAEVEEQIAREGLPAISDVGSDECCEDAEVDGFTCDWEIQRIVLPDTMFLPDDDKKKDSAPAAPAANADPASLLASSQAAMGSATSMAMSYVFPILKPSLEAQIRRATVTVRWTEGDRPLSFDVTQYVVAEQQKLPDANNPTPGATTPAGGSTSQQPASLPGLGGILGGGLLGGGMIGGGK